MKLPRSTGRRAAAAATAVTLGAGTLLAGQSDAQASAWVPTATKALTLANVKHLGAASSAAPLRLTVGLTPRHTAALRALIKAQNTHGSGSYGKFLTPKQFTDRYAATSATAKSVRSYLHAQGMHHVAVSSNRLDVTANATVGQAERAFHTKIAKFGAGRQTFLANTAAALVPASLGKKVSGVLGLSTIKADEIKPEKASTTPKLSTLPNLDGYYPKDFDGVYDTWGTNTGKKTTLAVIAEGNLAPTIKDLRLAEKNQGLPQVPYSLQYAGIKSPDTSGADEWDLDTQTSTGVAPDVQRLYIYIATSLTDADLARAINLFVSQDVANAGSASLGECDVLAQMDGSTTIDDIAFAEAAVQGQTFFASSGDTGSSCALAPTNGAPGSGPTDTEYPASSTYVTGVGGTTLDATKNASGTYDYSTEIAWNAGGGGLSPIEYPGYWTDNANNLSTGNLRGVPDVAFDADPTTGANIFVDGAVEEIGGTSLASPLALGLWTRINASSGRKLGFAPPKLYALYDKAKAAGGGTLPPSSVPGFHDVTLGANGVYTALPGYDYTTGLGSWDVGKLAVALRAQK